MRVRVVAFRPQPRRRSIGVRYTVKLCFPAQPRNRSIGLRAAI